MFNFTLLFVVHWRKPSACFQNRKLVSQEMWSLFREGVTLLTPACLPLKLDWLINEEHLDQLILTNQKTSRSWRDNNKVFGKVSKKEKSSSALNLQLSASYILILCCEKLTSSVSTFCSYDIRTFVSVLSIKSTFTVNKHHCCSVKNISVYPFPLFVCKFLESDRSRSFCFSWRLCCLWNCWK